MTKTQSWLDGSCASQTCWTESRSHWCAGLGLFSLLVGWFVWCFWGFSCIFVCLFFRKNSYKVLYKPFGTDTLCASGLRMIVRSWRRKHKSREIFSMNRYGSPLLGAQAATGLQKHTFQSASVEADKESVLQIGDAQSAITELGHRKGFAQEKQAPRPFHQPHLMYFLDFGEISSIIYSRKKLQKHDKYLAE